MPSNIGQQFYRNQEKEYLRYLRLKMWVKNPLCKYCGIETIIPNENVITKGKPMPPNIATIDHKYSRYNPLRSVEPQEYILCCNLCNNYRAQLEEDKIPIEILRERSSRSKHRNAEKQNEIKLT